MRWTPLFMVLGFRDFGFRARGRKAAGHPVDKESGPEISRQGSVAGMETWDKKCEVVKGR